MRQLLIIFVEAYCFAACAFPWCYFVVLAELGSGRAKVRFAVVGAACYAALFLPQLLFPQAVEWVLWQTDPFWMATTKGKW